MHKKVTDGSRDNPCSLAFLPLTREVASGYCSGSFDIRIMNVNPSSWNAGGNKKLSAHTGGVVSLAVLAQGAKLASGSLDNTIRVWDLTNGRMLLLISGHSDR